MKISAVFYINILHFYLGRQNSIKEETVANWSKRDFPQMMWDMTSS